nr:hypothetical protein [Tanacetum cinerariifolium]
VPDGCKEFLSVWHNRRGGQAGKKTVPGPRYVLLPLLTSDSQGSKSSEDEIADDAGKKSTKVPRKENGVQDPAKEDYLVKRRLLTLTSLTDFIQKRKITIQRNEFKSMFRQDKDANKNRTFTPVSAVGSSYVNLGGSIPVNAVTLPNTNLPTDPLMPDLDDTADL